MVSHAPRNLADVRNTPSLSCRGCCRAQRSLRISHTSASALATRKVVSAWQAQRCSATGWKRLCTSACRPASRHTRRASCRPARRAAAPWPAQRLNQRRGCRRRSPGCCCASRTAERPSSPSRGPSGERHIQTAAIRHLTSVALTLGNGSRWLGLSVSYPRTTRCRHECHRCALCARCLY